MGWWSTADEISGAAHLAQLGPEQWPTGRIWPWVVAAIAIVGIVLGAVLFTPEPPAAAAAPVPIAAHLTPV